MFEVGYHGNKPFSIRVPSLVVTQREYLPRSKKRSNK
jgi:hypothetical protein